MPTPHYTPGPRSLVLVVDDYADACEIWKVVLHAEGFDVRTAATGPEALATAIAERPHVVVLDLALPGLSGVDVARALRGRDDTRGTRIIALTGCSDPQELQTAREAGFDALLMKPCIPNTLVAEIRRLLAGQDGPDEPAVAADSSPQGTGG